MSSRFTRRDFLAGLATVSVAAPVWAQLKRIPPERAASPIPELRVHPFELGRVRLSDGPWLSALETNRRYMLDLDPDRLLHMFRVTAALPSTAQPYGGWEAPVNELRGHFEGHYLSACALMFAQTGDDAIGLRARHLIDALARCQDAHRDGYLSAFPREFFERLRDGKRVWAPFYTYHKIMAGLYDAYVLMDNEQALSMLKGMADWTRAWAEPLTDEQLQKTLNVEHGGMTEVLYNLGSATGDQSYIDLGHRFDHERILAPLAAGKDELTNVHGNTNVPKIIGAARRYELTGEPASRDLSEYFWREIALERSYATGGSTSGEGWKAPRKLAHTLNEFTQETCVTYNMLKLTRHLFTWSADAQYADFYERAFFNGILPTQHPADGEKAYYTPLASGYWKLFGTPGQGFWCCHGSGVENFAKAGDSIYFHDDQGIYVNLFVASEVRRSEYGLRLVQETKFPESDTMKFTVHTRRPARMALRIRVPYWTAGTSGGWTKLNGKVLRTVAEAKSYRVVDRLWRDGDRLEVRFPMRLHLAAMPDDSTVQAIMYGPLVLAGRMGTDGITNDNRRAGPTEPRKVPEFKNANPPKAPELTASSEDPAQWIKPVAGKPLEFRTTGQPKDFTLVPLYQLFDERYAVYWKVNCV